ncbi:hypothetical protein ScPMuIL_007489 [Solemya velum]
MTVCKYFLSGNCRYGNKCWNEHPEGGGRGYSYTAQRNLFGGAAAQKISFRDSFGNSNNNGQNPFKWQSSSFQNQGQSPTSPSQQGRSDEAIKIFLQEIATWEDSKMWPFSCVSIEKDISSLPELEDISPEELRLEAYECQKSGNVQLYTEKVRKMLADVLRKRNELKQANPQMKQNLTIFLEEERKKKSNPADPSQNDSIFGQSSSGNFGLFSQTANGGQSSSLFGAGSSGIFGNASGVQTPVIGGGSPREGGLFGKGGGSPQQGSPALFGSNTPSTGGLFGKGSTTPLSASTSGFDSTGSTGLFGKGVCTPQPQSASIFGSNSTGGLFGKAPSTQQTTGIFGTGTQGFGIQQTGSVIGGSSSSQPVTPSVFGNSQIIGTDAIPFPQKNAPNSGASSSPEMSQTVPSPTKKHKSSVYSELSDLTQEELAQFQAQFFTLGKIPMKPPPRELIRI